MSDYYGLVQIRAAKLADVHILVFRNMMYV